MESLNKIMKQSRPIDKNSYLYSTNKIKQWLDDMPKNEEKMINDYLSLHEYDNSFTKALRKATSFYIAYEHHKYSNSKYFLFEYSEYGFDIVIKKYDRIFDIFNTMGIFLNPIIESNPHSNIINELSLWLVAYMSFNKSSHFKNPSQIITKDINTINKCRSILADRLEGYFGFCMLEEYYDDTFFKFRDMFDTLDKLENDLTNKTFELIHKNNYYPIKPTKKEVLKEILESYTKEYNIKNCLLDIKQLKDAI